MEQICLNINKKNYNVAIEKTGLCSMYCGRNWSSQP